MKTIIKRFLILCLLCLAVPMWPTVQAAEEEVALISTPQELVGMIVEKALNMAKMMDIPVLGIVENMSWIACPDCASADGSSTDGPSTDGSPKEGSSTAGS